MGREFELKYRATPAVLAQIGEALGPFQTIKMETTYYDVPSGALSKLHWTLRRRMENEKSVCTVKTPCPDGGRKEWEVECARIEEAVPMLIGAGVPELLAEYTSEGIVPVCGARFLRLAKTISVPGGVVELALDRGVFLGGGKEEAFAELEVELKQGEDLAAIAYAEKLAAQYGLVPEAKSKLARARALAQSGEKA